MIKPRFWWVPVAVMFLAACGGKGQPAAKGGRAEKVPNVSVQPAALRDMTETILVTGAVHPIGEAVVAAETAGLVERVPVTKGQRVKAGQVLAEIARQSSRNQLDLAEAALAQARLAREEAALGQQRAQTAVETTEAQIRQAKLARTQAENSFHISGLNLTNRNAHFERVRKLYDQKLVAQAAFDDASVSLKSMQADHAAAGIAVDTAKEAVTLAEQGLAQARLALEGSRLGVSQAESGIAAATASLAQARLHYDKGLVTAPFDALVDDLYLDPGEYAKVEALVAHLIQADRVKVAFGAAERDVTLLKVGQEASFTLDSLPGQTFTGRVTFIALSSDSQTGTYPVEITAPNPDGRLRAGMVAQVLLTRRTVSQAVAAPTFAVVPKEEGDVVFVLAGDKAARRKVETGIRENGWIQVVSGLAAGEPLIVKGQRDLQDGQTVKVIR